MAATHGVGGFSERNPSSTGSCSDGMMLIATKFRSEASFTFNFSRDGSCSGETVVSFGESDTEAFVFGESWDSVSWSVGVVVISLTAEPDTYDSEAIESDVSFDSMFSTDGGDEEVVLSTTVDSAASRLRQSFDPTILEVEETVVYFVTVGSGAFSNEVSFDSIAASVGVCSDVVAFSITVDSTMSISEASDIGALEWSEASFDSMSSTIKVVFEWAACTQGSYWDLKVFLLT